MAGQHTDPSNGNPEKKAREKKEAVHSPKEDALEKWTIRKKESTLIRKIVFSIIFVGFVLFLTVGFVGYNYVKNALQPADSADRGKVEVEIPLGTSTKGIARLLEEESIIKDATVFNYYMKTKNVPEFKAGFYEFSPSMELDEVIAVLDAGGSAAPQSEEHKILVKEGATLEEIAEEIAAKTKYTKEEFLEKANDETFIEELQAEFPKLLTDALQNKEIKYKLEGYLFPATYDYMSRYTLEEIIQAMVAKTNEVLKPYREKIAEKGMDIHSVLTFASLVEKEGVKYEDRQKIAGVFYNRLKEDMPLQSDVSILYALNEHLEYVSVENTEVDSPYNLYQHKGLGPGPFNSPSEKAVEATLDPIESDNYYFLADIHTGEVYFSKTFEEHLELQEKYIKEAPSESADE